MDDLPRTLDNALSSHHCRILQDKGEEISSRITCSYVLLRRGVKFKVVYKYTGLAHQVSRVSGCDVFHLAEELLDDLWRSQKKKKEAWKWTFERMSRFCFVGATLDLKASNEEPKVNHWCELSSLRLFDASGKNVAPLASRISFTQKPGEGDETHVDLKIFILTPCVYLALRREPRSQQVGEREDVARARVLLLGEWQAFTQRLSPRRIPVCCGRGHSSLRLPHHEL